MAFSALRFEYTATIRFGRYRPDMYFRSLEWFEMKEEGPASASIYQDSLHRHGSLHLR